MIFDNLLTVSGQAMILFLMMAIGFALYKTHIVSKEGADGMTNTLLWAVTPCLLIDTFSRDFDKNLALSLGVFAAAAFVGTVLSAVLAYFLFRRKDSDTSAVMRFCCTFSNCGFMGLPLADALYGDEGVMYASIFVAVFNLTQWTFGFAILSGKGASLKKLLINPGVMGLTIGLPLFIFSMQLPSALSVTVSTVASMNTPLAMIVIGCYLARAKIFKALTDKNVFEICAVRLLVVPAIALVCVNLIPLPLSAVAKSTLCIEFAAPVAASVALLSAMCGRDAEFAGRCVAISTLFSIVTLPVVATIGGMIF